MVFSYYTKLSKANKAIYRKSDKIETLIINVEQPLYLSVEELRACLETGNRKNTEQTARTILNVITNDLGAPALKVKVLSSRPSNDVEELHGLYEPCENRKLATITVWMRTAKHKKVVAFRSFLRTLLHELCHHLDYELFLLPDSFHTEGFFKREAHLFKQLMNESDV